MASATEIVGKCAGKGTGEMRLYKVDPPMLDWYDVAHEYVIVSATVAYSGPETYIFPADADGNVVEWGELDGSYRGGLSHRAALANAGYDLTE